MARAPAARSCPTAIQIGEAELATVRAILCRQLPTSTCLWVLRSRVRGMTKRFADLDLSVDALLPLRLRALIETDF